MNVIVYGFRIVSKICWLSDFKRECIFYLDYVGGLGFMLGFIKVWFGVMEFEE